MKINTATRFPYPVLSAVTNDYNNGSFSVEYYVDENPKTGKLKINYEVSLKESGIESLVASKQAEAGLFVTCLDTFFSRMYALTLPTGSIEIPDGTLRGKVLLRPLIYTTREIPEYSNGNLNEEYLDMKLTFTKGALLAIGSECTINVGHEKLAPMESIFNLAVNPTVPDAEIRVDADCEKITIHCGKDVYHTICNLRLTKKGKDILINSVYLPAVMEVLSILKDGTQGLHEKKWFNVFNAKCEHLSIDYTSGSLLDSAQKLLKAPISRLNSIGEDL